jgi:hypothetical protein
MMTARLIFGINGVQQIRLLGVQVLALANFCDQVLIREAPNVVAAN